MRFSVYQVSRKGGREKNEDRMGYCYTRESGLFALADGMGGHPEGEVASQLALQTLAALFQRDCKPTLHDPLRFLHESIIAGHHQLLRYATQKALIDTPRTTVVACLLQGNAAYWAHCGDSRLYLVRGDKLIARTRDHSYSELQQTMSQVVPMGDRFNRNVLFTCLGSPGKPVVDTVGPLLLQRRRPAPAVLRRPVGHGRATARSPISSPTCRSPTRCPSWSSRRCATAAPRATTSRCSRSSGKAPRPATSGHGISTNALGDGGVRLHHPGQRARHRRRARRARRRRDRALDPEINEAIQRSAKLEEVLSSPGRATIAAMTFQRSARSPSPTSCAPSRITRGFTNHAEGSVLIDFGDTRVLCTASVEEKVPPHKRGSGEGWVTAEYGMLPRATHTRSDREAARGKQSGRTQEIQRLIGRSLRAVFDLTLLGERTIYARLRRAAGRRRHPHRGDHRRLRRRRRRGDLAAGQGQDRALADPRRRSPRSRSASSHGTPLLDLEYVEDAACDTDMNVVMTGAGGFVECRARPRARPSRAREMDALLALAGQGHRRAGRGAAPGPGIASA